MMNIDEIYSLVPKDKKQLFKEAIDQSNEGHCLECGVWKGGSINYLASIAPDKIFHGFDSFEGLPESWDKGGVIYKEGHFAVKGLPAVRANVILHKGWFDQTLPKWKQENEGNIGFLHIDSDLYSSCKTILEVLNDRIVPGTIILFDELCDFAGEYSKWKDNEWRATEEWLEKFNRKLTPLARTSHFQVLTKVEV